MDVYGRLVLALMYVARKIIYLNKHRRHNANMSLPRKVKQIFWITIYYKHQSIRLSHHCTQSNDSSMLATRKVILLQQQ